jgi:putative Holliday junction resolvase
VIHDRRILGLDVGERRIGIAISDASGMLATPLTTIQATPQAQAIAQLVTLTQEHAAVLVVVGLPLTLRGEVGPQAQAVQTFGDALAAELPCPIQFFDERLTTVAAEQMMRDMGIKPERRKQQIDQVAAAIILQDFLDHHRNRES